MSQAKANPKLNPPPRTPRQEAVGNAVRVIVKQNKEALKRLGKK